MSDVISTLFNDYDRGRLSRRRLLQALGVAMAAGPMSTLARAQGQCADRGRAGDPACDTTPAKLPFDPTGWKTMSLDRFYMAVPDYQKEAAFLKALMNWEIRSDDGKQALLDIGDWGGFMIRGGYVAPPPPAPRAQQAPPAGADASAAGAAGAAAGGGAAGGGRGGGRGGAGGGNGAPRAPRMAADGFCWGIEPWDAKKVEAALKARGLDPVADNEGKDFQSFHVKDPDGFHVQISNGTIKNRHSGKPVGKTGAPAPFESTNWKTVWLDHISFQVTNYKESVAFYQALLGWKPGSDEGSQNQCEIGDVGGIIIRGRSGIAVPGQPAPTAPRRASIDHIAFGITPWDVDGVKAELEKRGLSASWDAGTDRNTDHKAAVYQSYHTNTANNFNLQISFVTKDKRNAGATPPSGRGGGGGTTWF